MNESTPSPGFKYRKLRIAFSGVYGILCLLLIALWVRSYSFNDILEKKTRSQLLQIHSGNGRLGFCQINPSRSRRIPASSFAVLLEELSQGRALVSRPISNSRLPTGSIVSTVLVPYWLPVLLTATVAAITLIPWSRRFSLRTLLIATTVVSAVLGTLVWAVK